MIPRAAIPPAGLAAEEAARHRASVPVLETRRLCLRAPRLDDLPVWTAIYAEPDSGFGGPYPAEQAWTEFCWYTAAWMLHGHGLFSVTRKEDGQTIGFVHLGLEWEDHEPELGWMFAQDARGCGYASEAAAAVRDWAFNLLPGFVSYVDPGNAPSRRLAERIGAARDLAAEAAFDGAIHVYRHTMPESADE